MKGDKVNSRSPFSRYDGDAGGVCVSHRGQGKCEYGRGSLPTESLEARGMEGGREEEKREREMRRRRRR